jgi:hypothetical protein
MTKRHLAMAAAVSTSVSAKRNFPQLDIGVRVMLDLCSASGPRIKPRHECLHHSHLQRALCARLAALLCGDNSAGDVLLQSLLGRYQHGNGGPADYRTGKCAETRVLLCTKVAP